MILSLKIPPHLKCVATLPCKMSNVIKAIENKANPTVFWLGLLHVSGKQ